MYFRHDAMESVFGTLKSECFYLAKFGSIEQRQLALHRYIRYYNRQRIKNQTKRPEPGIVPNSGLDP